MKALILMLTGALAAAPVAQAISRVGNSHIGDPVLGFRVETPEDFSLRVYEDVEDEAVLVSKRAYLQQEGGRAVMRPARLRVHHLASVFAELSDFGREETAEWVAAWEEESWEPYAGPNPCVDVYVSQNDSAYAAILAWGSGKGLVMVGEKLAPVAHEIGRWIARLELDEEACEWPNP